MTTNQPPTIDEIISRWPKTARESAKTVLDKYGPQDEATEHMLAWRGAGPWKWSVITDVETEHQWPTPHIDVLEQAIDYRVPPEGEEANYLAINLAHEIVTGERSVGDARDRYAEAMQAMTEGKDDPYTQGLRFDPPSGGTADPDQQAL
jgi:hypothetical protein